MASRLSDLCIIVYLFVALSRGCILLLDGWIPLTANERAKLADVVVIGRINKSYKAATNASTYSAQVDILRVLKGRLNIDRHDIIQKAGYVSESNRRKRRQARRKSKRRNKRKYGRFRNDLFVSDNNDEDYLNDNSITNNYGISPITFHGYIARYGRHNVSNFGDKSLCYSEVDEDKIYILFLTIFNGKLTAKYDDLFGAVDDFSEEKERSILSTLG